jgi:hypothetical protein
LAAAWSSKRRRRAGILMRAILGAAVFQLIGRVMSRCSELADGTGEAVACGSGPRAVSGSGRMRVAVTDMPLTGYRFLCPGVPVISYRNLVA